MKKLLIAVLALCLALSMSAAPAEQAEDLGVWPAVAGENGTTYVSLFDAIVTDEWNPLWQDYISAVMGEDAAPAMTAALQGSVTSNLHGEEAIAAFTDGGYAFDCHFINGAQSLTFKDNTVTILKTDGTRETHTYEYLGHTTPAKARP